MSDHEKNVIFSLVALLVTLVFLTLLGIYHATIIFEDGSFILPNGWYGCFPWAICWG
ncbi:MAG: hypothetical protein ACYTFW_20835 [Planctomycetota bacterium]|jgi:hypothetical protein